ncbi:MAG: hypothetical protein Q8O00_13265, partial [Holophaga sp.]|nr:hypothetical protein [Holophaga sp.]
RLVGFGHRDLKEISVIPRIPDSWPSPAKRAKGHLALLAIDLMFLASLKPFGVPEFGRLHDSNIRLLNTQH